MTTDTNQPQRHAYTVTALTPYAIAGSDISDSGGVRIHLSRLDGCGALAFVLEGANGQAWLRQYPVGATLTIPEDAPLFTLLDSGLIIRLPDGNEGDTHA